MDMIYMPDALDAIIQLMEAIRKIDIILPP